MSGTGVGFRSDLLKSCLVLTAVRGPVLGPPCILQRPIGMAAPLHGVPARVRAPQRGALPGFPRGLPFLSQRRPGGRSAWALAAISGSPPLRLRSLKPAASGPPGRPLGGGPGLAAAGRGWREALPHSQGRGVDPDDRNRQPATPSQEDPLIDGNALRDFAPDTRSFRTGGWPMRSRHLQRIADGQKISLQGSLWELHRCPDFGSRRCLVLLCKH